MIKDERFEEILFTQEQIEEKIKELAKWVNETYENSNDLIIIGILKGCVPFLAHLIKDMKVDHIIDFMTVSTYKGGTESSGNIKMIMDLAFDIKNKDVLVIEDIIDSGITLSKIRDNLISRNPKTFRILALLNKNGPGVRKKNIEADKYGFLVPDKFLAGFGLDVQEKLRNLPYIGVYKKDC